MTNPNNLVGSDGELLSPQPIPKPKPHRAWVVNSWLPLLGIGQFLASCLLTPLSDEHPLRYRLCIVASSAIFHISLMIYIVLTETPIRIRKKRTKKERDDMLEKFKIQPAIVSIRPFPLSSEQLSQPTEIRAILAGLCVPISVMFGAWTMPIWQPTYRSSGLPTSWFAFVLMTLLSTIMPMFIASDIREQQRRKYIFQNGELITGLITDSIKTNNTTPGILFHFQFERPDGSIFSDTNFYPVGPKDQPPQAKTGDPIAVCYVDDQFFLVL